MHPEDAEVMSAGYDWRSGLTASDGDVNRPLRFVRKATFRGKLVNSLLR